MTQPAVLDPPSQGYSTSNNPAIEPISSSIEMLEIDIDLVKPSAFNPRKHFAPDAIADLAASIKLMGVLEPIVVRDLRDLGAYEIIAGERRWRAAKQAGLQRIPAVVRTLTDVEASEIALIENLQRENLNPLEEAEGFARLLELGRTQTDLAARLNRSQPYIANSCRMLQLPETVRDYVRDGRLSRSHAVTLCSLSADYPRLLATAEEAIEAHWSVRALEDHIRELASHLKPATVPSSPPQNPAMSDGSLQVSQESVGQIACPRCQSTNTRRTGSLVHEYPGGPALDPAPDMYRCYDCKNAFRADGVPFDQEAHSARYAQAREANSAAEQDTSDQPAAAAASEASPQATRAGGPPIANADQSPVQTSQPSSSTPAVNWTKSDPPKPPTTAPAAATPPAAKPEPSQQAMVGASIPQVLDDWLWDNDLTVQTALELLRRMQTALQAASFQGKLPMFADALDAVQLDLRDGFLMVPLSFERRGK